MSRRHHISRQAKHPEGAARPARWARRQAARKARHDERALLADVRCEDDALGLVDVPDAHRNRVADAGVIPPERVEDLESGRRRFKVWKTKAWKRRTSARHARNELLRQADELDLDLDQEPTDDREPGLEGQAA